MQGCSKERGIGNAGQGNTAQRIGAGDAGDAGGGGSDTASTASTGVSSRTRTNSAGESHCCNCGEKGDLLKIHGQSSLRWLSASTLT